MVNIRWATLALASAAIEPGGFPRASGGDDRPRSQPGVKARRKKYKTQKQARKAQRRRARK